ncbi:hypothetical protein [Geminocystis herdmanii]|uniref:hypothetical protein n=1 Tax=Geminocystis herdmanii TaxID=669359 RepID=UPI00035F8DC0|nr:hypothetical protein [Geminocystis herdmanii]
MPSPDSWTCNGVPQNGKEYSGLGFPHDPHENYSSDCEICGLPKDSVIVPPPPPPPLPITALLVALLALIIGGGGLFFLFANSCQQGLEKIEGVCIDPFLEPYEVAKSQGDQAINLFNNYQSPEDLEESNNSLENAIKQLQEIPSTALIHPQALQTMEVYTSEKEKIAKLIDLETIVLEKLTKIDKKINEAKKLSDNAKNLSEYEQAKKKWQQLQNELNPEDFKSSQLAFKKIQEYRDQSDWEIQCLDKKISGDGDCCTLTPQPSYCLF